MRRTTTLGALAAGLALIAAAPASAHHPRRHGQARSPAGSTTRAMSRSRRTATSGSPRRARRRRRSRVELVLRQRRGPRLHGRHRRDHAHRPLGPEARRDRPRVVRRPRPATARSARTASSPTATTSTSPTAARPARPRRRPDEHRPARPDARVRGAGLALLRHAAQGHAPRRPSQDRRPVGDSRTRTTRTPAVGNPLVDSNPVDVYADHGRFFVADAGGNSVLRVGRWGGISPVAIFPNRDVAEPVPAGRRPATRIIRCRRSRPPWSRARTARST